MNAKFEYMFWIHYCVYFQRQLQRLLIFRILKTRWLTEPWIIYQLSYRKFSACRKDKLMTSRLYSKLFSKIRYFSLFPKTNTEMVFFTGIARLVWRFQKFMRKHGVGDLNIVTRTLMARLPRLFRTRSWVPWKKSFPSLFFILFFERAWSLLKSNVTSSTLRTFKNKKY